MPTTGSPTPDLHLTNAKLTLAALDLPTPFAPDEGGGDGGTAGPMPVLAFILGFFPGIGLGHLVAGHFGGFVGFLVTDVVLLAVIIVLTAITPPIFYIIGWAAWIGEHIYEGIDAARAASAGPVAERESSDRMMWATRPADRSPPSRVAMAPAVRALSLEF